MQQLKTLTIAATASFAAVFSLNAAMPSQEEMWKLIQEQQKQIAELKARVNTNQTVVATVQTESARTKAEAQQISRTLSQTQAQLDATTIAVEEASSGTSGGWWEKTSVGGYGELHMNFNDNADDAIDFHRYVLFINHDFNDWIGLFTEFELEHSLAGDGKPGEVELEQAFIRMDWSEQFSTDAGLFLMPVGILNETHEPNTFYGVERNRVENRIIPTTWWEGGLKGTYRLGNGLAFDAAITSGVDIDGELAVDTNDDDVLDSRSSNSYRIRSGRQKVAQAINNEAAYVGRVKYTGVPGLEIAGSVLYQNDVAQSSDDDFSGLLTTAHVIYNYKGFGIKALYAQWTFDGDTVDPEAEEQRGWYLEPSYRWNALGEYGDLGVFVRYEDYEYYRGTSQRENEVTTLGINYWPTENVVFKADYQSYDNGSSDNGNDSDHSINLGVGYQF
jgi:hypothetical protein